MHPSEREPVHSPTPRARACRRPGQRLKKSQRRKLQQQFLNVAGTVHNGQAMKDLGLSRSTLYWWRRDPEFERRYQEKLATYELTWEPMTDEQYEQAAQRLAMLPDWQIIRRVKLNERMAARRGEPHTIWW